MEISRKQAQAISELRGRLINDLPSNYDTDFNLLRWIINAEKLSGVKSNLDMAEKQVRNHLRYRKALKLDEPGTVPSLDENPLYKFRLIPRGSLTLMNKVNKFVWYTEYKTLDLAGFTKAYSTSDILKYHLWAYEAFLKMVNEQEARTKRMSGIIAVLDMADYAFNPATAVLFNNGQMTYYVSAIHYDHYPQLAYPIYAINVPKWLYLLYKMIKVVLPKDINDRIRVLDHNFKHTFGQDFDLAEMPECLGGALPDSVYRRYIVEARRWASDELYRASAADPAPHECLHLQVNARRRKFVPFECRRAGTALHYYFTSDAEITFGVFVDKTLPGQQHHHAPIHNVAGGKMASVFKYHHQQHVEVDTDALTMIEPLFCLSAKFVPEQGIVLCEWPGTYYFVFWNKNSWISRRNIYLKLDLLEKDAQEQDQDKLKNLVSRTFSTN